MTTRSEATARKFDEPQGLEIVHGSYWPLDLRQDAGVVASIKVEKEGSTTTFETPLWRISPLGAEYQWHQHHPTLNLGDLVDISVLFKNQQCNFCGIIVSDTIETLGKKLMGIRWCDPEATNQTPRQTRRISKRWICSNSFLPTAVAPNPILYNDLLIFRMVDFSKNGARMLTSMRNKFIIPQMWFNGIFTFPMIGSAHGRFQVRWTDLVSTNGKQELTLGVEFDKPSRELTKSMGEYVLQFGDMATIKEIRESGLHVSSTARAVEIGYVRTQKEYEEVINLRRSAYQVYRENSNDEIKELSDIFDSRARILVAKHHGTPVATSRIIFHDTHEKLEQEHYVKLAADLPRNDELIEVTRICSHPDYRASDLVYELFKHTLIAMIQAKRRYLVGSAPDHLVDFYKKLGGKFLNASYSPKSCPNLRLHVMIFDAVKFLKGVNVNPVLWAHLGEDILKLAVEEKFVEMDTMARIRISAFRCLKPFTGHILKQVAKKKKKKKK